MSHLKAKRISMNRTVYFDNRLAKYTNLPMYTGNTSVEHNLNVGGNLDILGSLSIHSDLHVDGNEFLGGNLDMSGNLHVNGNEYIRGNLDVSGNQTTTGNLRVYGNEVLTGNLDVSGNQAVTGNARIYGNQVLTGSLDVSGNVTTTQDVHSRSVYTTGNYYLDNYVLIPAGTVIQSAAINAPAGWLNCDGSLVSRTTYPDLFSAIAYTYGGSDTSFNLPDLRGRACIGAGQGVGLTNRALGSAGGEENHTLTSDQMPSHTHSLIRRINPDDGAYDPGNVYAGESSACTTDRATSGNFQTLSAGLGASHNNMQPFLALRFLIKY
jgi:microcystin-dependent protein/cytoskeletal protein CcmA (bactofilin family)